MKRLPLLLALPLFAACGDQYGYREEWSHLYDRPATETTSDRIERREIIHWGANPKDKKRIGFLHKWETKVAGSRSYRESWSIMDKLGVSRVGFITAEGVFYRYDANGQLGEKVGEYPIVSTGLKIFFKIPLSEHIDLEEIDPYK
jgi:hypothetical protein